MKHGRYVDNLNIIRWFCDGLLHRDNGLAFESCCKKEWYKNGQLHRLDGPAVEWKDGTKEWYKNGTLHREDGPAIEVPFSKTENEYFLNGFHYLKYEYEYLMSKRKLNEKLQTTLEEKKSITRNKI